MMDWMIVKISLIFAILAASMVLILQVTDVLQSQDTLRLLTQVFSVVAILGFASALINLIVSRSSSNESNSPSDKPGPRF